MLTSAPAFAAVIAVWGFWGLILIGLVSGELGVRRTAIFVALWIAGRIAAAYVLYGQLFAPYVAVLDIALVFLIFKGDVRLS